MKIRNRHLKLLILAMVSVLVFSMASHAALSPAPRWSHLMVMSGQMSIGRSGLARITAECQADYLTVNKVKLKTELQRLEKGSWKTIKTWTETDNSNVALYEKSYAVYKNYSYRLKITGYAYKNNSLVESATETFNYGYYQ